MLNKFNPITQDTPIVFNEDVYLITDSGKVLAGRHGGEPIKNIFSLTLPSELTFVYDNMFFAGLQPLLLIDSETGPIFIDDSLFGSHRLLIAIIPHFSRAEVLAIVKEKLSSIVLASPLMKEELKWDYYISFDTSHQEFAERLINTHRGPFYYRVHGRTNGDLSMMISEVVYDYSSFCGCELEFNVHNIGLFEMKNDLSTDALIFALVSLLFIAREYSTSRRAKMDLFFDEMGIYFEFGFELASEHREKPLIKESELLKNFKFWASSRLFECDYYQNNRAFAVRGFPWFVHPNSADIKEPKKEFIYNL